jgi:glutathione S-transferase
MSTCVTGVAQRKITFFHAPQSRSSATLSLLEELNAEYEIRLIDLKKGEQREAAYLSINPMGKVPAILHEENLVTEQPAIFLYLTDLYHESGLAPEIGDPLRGPYLRWMVYYGSSFEPALVDRTHDRDPISPIGSPYGAWEDVLRTVNAQLAKGAYMLGDRYTAVDLLWGGALHWSTLLKLVPETPTIRSYVDRIIKRPAIQRMVAIDAKFLSTQSPR